MTSLSESVASAMTPPSLRLTCNDPRPVRLDHKLGLRSVVARGSKRRQQPVMLRMILWRASIHQRRHMMNLRSALLASFVAAGIAGFASLASADNDELKCTS